MKRLLTLLLVATSLAAGDNSISKPEADDGWLLLFDGDSIFGWTTQSGQPWRAADGSLAPASDHGFLRTNSAFADFILKFDYRGTSASDCSVSARAAIEGDPPDNGYQIQLGDTKPAWPTGSVIDHFKAESVHPAAGQWHSVEATFSGDKISVKLDGRGAADGKNPRAKAGVIVFGCGKSAGAQFRNIKLKPLIAKALFNGTDLSGWKAVGPPPPKKEGKIKKMMGGGSKPKEAQWSVAAGAVHAQGGVGQLETTALYDDFVLQIALRVNSHNKGDHARTAVFFRGDAGQLSTGYEMPVLSEYRSGNRSQALPESTGALKGLQTPRKVLGDDNQYIAATIAAYGRHIQIWIDGYPVSDYQDTRAEGTTPQREARTTAGTITLQSPDEKANLDFRNIRLAQLPKALGKGPAEATAVQPPPIAVPTAPPAQPGAPAMPAMPAAPAVDPNVARTQAKVHALMDQALATSDPQQQAGLYKQILEQDPTNQVAFMGLKDAQQKVDDANAKRAQEQAQQQQQSQTEAEKQSAGESARQKAESSFLAGDLDTAHTQIGIAQKTLSGDSGVHELAGRIESALQARTRLRMLWGGVGVAALFALIAAWWASRGKKEAYLEVIDGLDKGKKYNLDQEVIHIGAVAEDGGNKNEIVVRDLERRISRFHCEIHKRQGKFFLLDCDSANGTKVDGKYAEPGKPVGVKTGARIELGGTCALRLGLEKKKRQA
jgi:hypothetical protein